MTSASSEPDAAVPMPMPIAPVSAGGHMPSAASPGRLGDPRDGLHRLPGVLLRGRQRNVRREFRAERDVPEHVDRDREHQPACRVHRPAGRRGERRQHRGEDRSGTQMMWLFAGGISDFIVALYEDRASVVTSPNRDSTRLTSYTTSTPLPRTAGYWGAPRGVLPDGAAGAGTAGQGAGWRKSSRTATSFRFRGQGTTGPAAAGSSPARRRRRSQACALAGHPSQSCGVRQ